MKKGFIFTFYDSFGHELSINLGFDESFDKFVVGIVEKFAEG